MDNYQIFISYRRDGGDALAGRLADRFNALGYKVFYDVESMRSGTFNTQILEAIAQCEAVLLVLPPNALDRCVNADDWVRQEISFALKNNKKIIPIMMRGFEFPKTLPADIDNIKNMEGVEASQAYFDAVIDRIQTLLNFSPVNCQREIESEVNIKIPLVLKTPDSEFSKLAPSIIQTWEKGNVFYDYFARNSKDLESEMDKAVSNFVKKYIGDESVIALYKTALLGIQNYIDVLNTTKPLLYKTRIAEIIWLFFELDHPKRRFYDYFVNVTDLLFECSMLDIAQIFYVDTSSCTRRPIPFKVLNQLSYTIQTIATDAMNTELKNNHLIMFFSVIMTYLIFAQPDKERVAQLKKYILRNYKYLKKKNFPLSTEAAKTVAYAINMCETLLKT